MSQFRMGPSGASGGDGPGTSIWPIDAQFDLLTVRYSNQGLSFISLDYSGSGIGSVTLLSRLQPPQEQQKVWQCPGGLFGDDWITQLDGTYGAEGINQIRISMRRGAASPMLGGTAGPRAFQYQIPDDYKFVGVFGCQGETVITSMGIIIQN